MPANQAQRSEAHHLQKVSSSASNQTTVGSFAGPVGGPSLEVFPMLMIILIVLLVLALGGGGWGYSRYGAAGMGPAGLILLLLAIFYFTGHMR
jgi:hypothetical protein